MQSGEKEELLIKYIYTKGFFKTNYRDEPFIATTSIKVVFRVDKKLAYFDCKVNITISYKILAEDGLYYVVDHGATVRLDALGYEILFYSYKDNWRNVKDVPFSYVFDGSVTKKINYILMIIKSFLI